MLSVWVAVKLPGLDKEAWEEVMDWFDASNSILKSTAFSGKSNESSWLPLLLFSQLGTMSKLSSRCRQLVK